MATPKVGSGLGGVQDLSDLMSVPERPSVENKGAGAMVQGIERKVVEGERNLSATSYVFEVGGTEAPYEHSYFTAHAGFSIGVSDSGYLAAGLHLDAFGRHEGWSDNGFAVDLKILDQTLSAGLGGKTLIGPFSPTSNLYAHAGIAAEKDFVTSVSRVTYAAGAEWVLQPRELKGVDLRLSVDRTSSGEMVSRATLHMAF